MTDNETPKTETEREYIFKQGERIINRIGLDIEKAREILEGIGDIP
jgi:hypothetical protein